VFWFRYLFCAATFVCFLGTSARAQSSQTGSFTEVPLAQLTDRHLAPLGQAALGIRASEWKHAESTNFVYHYFHSYVAAPVSVEAEFYYRVIAAELTKDTAAWERKSHIFIFETVEEWAEFQKRAALDPWTGGVHAGGELFIRRDPQFKFKDNTLGHEVAHLVVDRFFGSKVPLWLNEGFAEHISKRCYAAFQRARGYAARPVTPALSAAQWIPFAELTGALAYPADPLRVAPFYHQSERLTRFLSGIDKAGFGIFFEAISRGARVETALVKGYGTRFSNLESLEREFRAGAFSDGTTAP
jgi:hypothetical protein